MPKLNSLSRWLAGAALVGALVFCVAGTDKPADILKSINDYRQDLVSKATAAGEKVDYTAISNQVKAKAQDAIKEVDPAKVAPAEAYEWAQLFSTAGKTKEAEGLLEAFIGTNPDAQKKFNAQVMLLGSAGMLDDNATIAKTLTDMKPYDAKSSLTYANYVSGYAGYAVDKLGLDKTMKMIDDALAGLPTTGLTEPEQKRAQSMKDNAVFTKIDILSEAKRQKDAVALIDSTLKGTVPDASKKRLSILRNQMTLVGNNAPVITAERSQGTFPGLEAWKGKVVIVDFFAHWCPPCKAAFPDMRKMFDDLHGKGLEMAGVTTYYGYYNAENREKRDMPKDVEFGKMADFVKEFNINWPVAYVDRAQFETYGVTAIPQTVVIDRKGVVHTLEIGYSKANFPKFRAEIEKLLNEK